MSQKVKLWEIKKGSHLDVVPEAPLKKEAQIHDWLEKDISVLSNDLLVIGREVPTDYGKYIDLLCLSRGGDLVIVELKKALTSREVVAQTLDYASWVKDLPYETLEKIANEYFRKAGREESLKEAYQRRFKTVLPETLNENHHMYIVATDLDSSTERIVNYLSGFHIGINAVTFQYFRKDDKEFLARVFVIEPELAQARSESRRRQNISKDELKAIAENNGVAAIYSKLAAGLTPLFDSVGTTRSSLAFIGRQGERMNTVFSLIPTESNARDGIKFQVYMKRFFEYFKLDEASAEAFLPPNKRRWQYYDSAPPEYSGYEGYFRDDSEVDKFLSGLRKQ